VRSRGQDQGDFRPLSPAYLAGVEEGLGWQNGGMDHTDTRADASGRPAKVSVCPFLGLRDDPSTRYDFPESTNRCYAASRRSAGSVAFVTRIVAAFSGTKRPQPIGAKHQATCCLTTAHETCARYRHSKGSQRTGSRNAGGRSRRG
jgi:hypothetical protein